MLTHKWKTYQIEAEIHNEGGNPRSSHSSSRHRIHRVARGPPHNVNGIHRRRYTSSPHQMHRAARRPPHNETSSSQHRAATGAAHHEMNTSRPGRAIHTIEMRTRARGDEGNRMTVRREKPTAEIMNSDKDQRRKARRVYVCYRNPKTATCSCLYSLK
ncbi:hypothetical protein R1flu_012791 [Riccia fluitans]|uniref:Uncharacterized protein n=1 Tax=Riccia fluitans TaxID=41844 RepID=A0ABD1ZCS7_9MARC